MAVTLASPAFGRSALQHKATQGQQRAAVSLPRLSSTCLVQASARAALPAACQAHSEHSRPDKSTAGTAGRQVAHLKCTSGGSPGPPMAQGTGFRV